jgi:hypothetical protein
MLSGEKRSERIRFFDCGLLFRRGLGVDLEIFFDFVGLDIFFDFRPFFINLDCECDLRRV